MDPERLGKLIQAYAAPLTAIGVVLAAITAVLKGWLDVSATLSQWSWREVVFASVALLVIGGVFARSRKARVSRLQDPDAIRLNPQSLDQLVGRAADLGKLAAALAQPLVFLVGESGCGKSTLLRIGVAQSSEFTARYQPIYIDMSAQDWDDGPLSALREGFLRALPAEDNRHQTLPARPGPRTFREAFLEFYRQQMRRPLLLLDQFDDYQARHCDRFLPDATRVWRPAHAIAEENGFWRVLRVCLAQDVLSVLVACREDAQGGLESVSFLPSPPRFQLPRLERGYVRRIIDQVTERPDGAPEVIADGANGWTKLRDRLVDELESRGPVLPQQLKIVLAGLRALPRLTVTAFARAGGLAGVEAEFVAGSIDRAARASGRHAGDILRLLIALVDRTRQPADKSLPRTSAELAALSGLLEGPAVSALFETLRR